MALNIKDPEAERLTHELARQTGESLTEVVVKSLRERLVRRQRRDRSETLRRELREIREHCSSLPVLDDRPADEILSLETISNEDPP